MYSFFSSIRAFLSILDTCTWDIPKISPVFAWVKSSKYLSFMTFFSRSGSSSMISFSSISSVYGMLSSLIMLLDRSSCVYSFSASYVLKYSTGDSAIRADFIFSIGMFSSLDINRSSASLPVFWSIVFCIF